jgi:hypothetical protein
MGLPENKHKAVPLEEAAALCTIVAKEYGLNVKQYEMLEAMTRAVPVQETVNGDAFVFAGALKSFADNMQRAISTEDSTFLRQQRGLKVDRVVDVEEFCESREYMNQSGYLRPAIKYKLIELFHESDDYVEAVLTGGIGIGKNYFGDMAMGYMIYLLSCYYNPQIEHDLAPGSSIVFIMQSKSHKLAKKVVFDQFAERLRLSPYFMNNFAFDPNVKSELRFPNNIYLLPVGGQDTAAIGMNVFGGIIDEMNFMARTSHSAKTAYSGEEEYDQAERLYHALIRRMKSRFMQKGKLPGKLLLISSTNYPGDFTDRKIVEAETDSTIFVMKYAQWEALPEDRFCGDTFPVEIGNDVKRSRILNDVSEAVDEADVIQVPIEYKTEFVRDLEAALRDLGGIATGSKHPFIPQRELIEKSQLEFEGTMGNSQLFRMSSCVVSHVIDSNSPDWEALVNHDYIRDCIHDPGVVFAVHIDVGLTQDAAGVVLSRIIGYKLLPTAMVYSERTNEFIEIRDIRAPIYCLDGVLRVTAPPSGEVDLELVRDLILHLRGYLNIRWATMDSYQSAMLIQGFRRAKIRSGILSVDTNIAPYAEVKQAVKDERLIMPRHDVLARELRELERDPEKDKVDHPAGGSKDCSDAAAGSVYMLQRKEAQYGRTSRRGGHRIEADGIRNVRIKTRRGRLRTI